MPVPSKQSGSPAAESDEERTTVDDGPPDPPSAVAGEVRVASKPSNALEESWEDRTIVEEEEPTREGPRPVPAVVARKDSAGVLQDDDEHLDTRDDDAHRFASGTGELGLSTVDEPTVDELRRPIPPLSPPPNPAAGKKPRRRPNAAQARIVVISGNDEGREFPLMGGQTTVGRGVNNDIVLTDIAVSRRHLMLDFDGKFYTLRDKASGNGTLVNDRLEDGAVQLRNGDRLELGNTVFRFDHPATKNIIDKVIGWGQGDADEEASTIAGRAPTRPPEDRPRLAPLPAPRNRAPLPAPGRKATQAAAPPPAPIAAAGPSVAGIPAAFDPARPEMSQQGMYVPAGVPAELPSGAENIVMTMPVQWDAYQAQTAQSRKQIIWLVSATLAMVLLAILVLVLRGDDGSAHSARAATTGTSESASAVDTESEARSAVSDNKTEDADPPAKDTPSARLPSTTWGTSETILASAAEPKSSALPVADEPEPIDIEPDPIPVSDDPPAKKDPPVKTAAKDPRKKKTDKKATKRTTKKTTKKKTTTSSAKIDAAKTRAHTLYKSKKYKQGAATLRAAAKSASKKDQDALNRIAKGYDLVDKYMTQGDAAKAKNPASALTAYRKALKYDKKYGKSVHATGIRAALARVAPKAAAAYMARKKYTSAKSAADAAVNYGSGGDATVARVRKALEREAGKMYSQAKKDMKKSPDKAKKNLRSILKMVPASSPWYAKAYKLLNSRKKSKKRDADER